MDDQRNNQNAETLYTRPPTIDDLLAICRYLNEEKARYVIIGGMAMNHYGLVRGTQDIDILVDDSQENMARVIRALSLLPDGAAKELAPEEIRRYTVIRINDEITVDLLARACGVTYADAESSIEIDSSPGVPLPFASMEILLRTKDTPRDQDRRDTSFLMELIGREKQQ